MSSSSRSPNLISNNSDRLWNTFFNQASQFIAILDTEGRVLEINACALLSQGAELEDYVGVLFWESPSWNHLPEWKSIWQQRLAKASAQNDSVSSEDVFRSKDGTIHYADTTTTAIYDSSNRQLSGYLISSIDTTKHQQIDNQKQKSGSRLDFFLQQSHIGSWEFNVINKTFHRSLTHDQIFGYESLLPDCGYDVFFGHIIPEERADIYHKVQQGIDNNKGWNIECQIVRKDGERRWILSSGGPMLSDCGRVELIAGIVQDITDIKQAEARHKEEFQSIFDALPDTHFRMKSDGTILDYRSQNKNDLYAKPESFIGQRMQDILPRPVGEVFQSKIDKIAQIEKTVIFKYELIINNKTNHFDARLDRISLDDQLICIVRNVTDEVESKKSLEASEKLFRSIFEQAALGVALVDINEGTFIRINKRYCDILGYTEEEMTSGKTFAEITHPEDLENSLSHLDKFFTGDDRGWTIEKRYIHKDGHVIWVEITTSSVWSIGETPDKVVVVVQDISQRKNNEKKLQLSSRVFSNTHEGIMIADAQKIIVDVNPAFEKITGYSLEDVLGKTPRILSSSKQTPSFYAQMWSEIAEKGHWQGEVWNRTKQGELYAELLNISSLMNENNEVTHYIGVFSDITSSKHQQDKLNLMAHYDELTKLPNRALFIDRFNQSIVHSRSAGRQLAVCFLDLDDFKSVNDTYGHEVGDRLLVEVANRIVACIKSGDTVSRQGGDEFAILLNDIESGSQYESIISRIHQAIASPCLIDDVQHTITVSTGVTLYPLDDGDIDTLLRHADQAMYQAKLLGKNRSQLHSPDTDLRIIKRNLQLDEIEQALGNQEFQLYYQPKVNMVTGVVFGVEALIRWIHPEKGLIPPLDFLPLIDDTLLEVRVGEWVIKEALQQLDAWRKQNINLEVSINISSNHLLSPSFVSVLEECLSHYPSVNAQYLQLEILESSSLGDLDKITFVIETCKKLFGVGFSLDDFGTGYSSLTHLRSLPVDTIKIDQSFVKDMLDDPSDYSIIDGVISLTKAFDRSVIAEGVETINHGLMLLLMGCQQAQGYAIAKPMPADLVSQWLRDYIPNKHWSECGSVIRDYQENSLEIFKLINEHWQEAIRGKIVSAPNDGKSWPIIDSNACYCGHWINQKKQDPLFKKEDVLRLEDAHNTIHRISRNIKSKYQAGDVLAARTDMAALEVAFESMNIAIDELKSL